MHQSTTLLDLMWEPCNLSRQTNANFPRFLCRDSSSMVSKKNGYICAVMYHFYDYVVYGLVCNNTWCDYSSTTPHNPHNSVLPLLLFGNLYIYESWYYSLCVVVYGMNLWCILSQPTIVCFHIFVVLNSYAYFRLLYLLWYHGQCCSYGILPSLILLVFGIWKINI